LLVDNREVGTSSNDQIVARLREMSVYSESRALPIGDYLWIAQGIDRAGGDGRGKVIMEVILGTVVERKTSDDFVKSIYGSRFNEQVSAVLRVFYILWEWVQ